MGAISADHLEQISDRGVGKIAAADVVGVTLPLTSLYTRQPYLNCWKLVERGVKVTVVTDFNPGSAPSYDLPLAMMLACNHSRLTPAETLKAATIYAAKAAGIESNAGFIEPGKSADIALLDVPDINFWMYHFRPDACQKRYFAGQPDQ